MYVVGVDLGQKRDHTAIVMVEKPYRHPLLSTQDETLTVRLAERLPLGISYPRMVEVVKHVARMGMRLGYVPGQVACKVVVDATGVGAPVVDALRQAGLGTEVTAVTSPTTSIAAATENPPAPAMLEMNLFMQRFYQPPAARLTVSRRRRRRPSTGRRSACPPPCPHPCGSSRRRRTCLHRDRSRSTNRPSRPRSTHGGSG